MKNFKHLASVFLITLFIILAFGSLFKKENTDNENRKDSNGIIKISAVNLYKEYTDNPVAADEKFKGKILKVDGKISLITQTKDGRICIMLEANIINGFIFCYFPESQSKTIAKFKPGDFWTIKGKCTGMQAGVILEDCEL